MIGFFRNIFSGGFTQPLIAVIVVLSTGLGLTVWYAKAVTEDKAKLETRYGEAVAAIDTWQAKYAEEQERRLTADRLAAEREAARDAIDTQNATLINQLEELKHDQDVKTYLDRPIPRALYDRLRDFAAGPTAAGSGQTDTPAVLAPGLPGSPSGRAEDRTPR